MDGLDMILKLTSEFLSRPDLIQGPGGNTSFKDNENRMFIKASGFRFEEMNESNGVSCVNYSNIRKYFRSVQPLDKVREEASMLALIAENILIKPDGQTYPKPSMETGFHAVLDTYVVHTHSVWTNLVNCASNRAELLEELRRISGLRIADIPFVSPGFGLSYLVTQALLSAESESKEHPQVFMLANHGVIAQGSDRLTPGRLLKTIDDSIRNLLEIHVEYPDTNLSGSGLIWRPVSGFVADTIAKLNANSDFFNQVLFPDQTVFFKGNLNFNPEVKDKKINVLADGITYNCGEREALSIHETMSAYLFIYDTLRSKNLVPKTIVQEEIDYINAMDMEKHRKSLF